MAGSSSSQPPWLTHILESKAAFKLVGLIYFLLLMGATLGAFKVASDDPQLLKDFGVLAAVLCGFAAGVLAHFTLKFLGADRAVIAGDARMKMYLFVGGGAAVLLALVLSIYNHNGHDARPAKRGRFPSRSRGARPL